MNAIGGLILTMVIGFIASLLVTAGFSRAETKREWARDFIQNGLILTFWPITVIVCIVIVVVRGFRRD